MSQGFWSKLKKPIFALAPMADVTDAAFRRIIAKYSKWGGENVIGSDGKFTHPHAGPVGGPDVMWTEFVSADGLAYASEEGRKKLMQDLIFTEAERPIVAQFFTKDPVTMRSAAELAVELGFDGIDINMGCPDRSIEKQGAGAALIKTPELTLELIQEAKKGAGDLPVSVKTRIGYNKDEIDSWIPTLLESGIAALTVHLRTRKEMSKVPAHWEYANRIVELRDKVGADTLILGNGDVLSLAQAQEKVEQTGVDGVMLGKAIFGNPSLFSYSAGYENKEVGSDVRAMLLILVEHTKLFEELLGETKNFAIMKKHYKAYVNGFDGAKELRMKLMETNSASEVETVVKKFLKT